MPTREQAEETLRPLLGSGKVPRLTPQVRALGTALPLVAEQWQALLSPELDALRRAIVERVWPAVQQRQDWESETG